MCVQNHLLETLSAILCIILNYKTYKKYFLLCRLHLFCAQLKSCFTAQEKVETVY